MKRINAQNDITSHDLTNALKSAISMARLNDIDILEKLQTDCPCADCCAANKALAIATIELKKIDKHPQHMVGHPYDIYYHEIDYDNP